MTLTKAEKARAMAYKRPALGSMGFHAIMDELSDIQAECDEVQYWIDSEDGTLLDAFDGDTEQEWEFKMAFADLSAGCYNLLDVLYDWGDAEDFDDCTVALIGNRYDLVGYDGYQEDYFSLTGYEAELAQTEAGKRLMRLTKAEMIAHIGQALGTLLAYYDLRQKYDYLKAAMDVLRDENHSIIQRLKDIDAAYRKAADCKWRYEAEPLWEAFERLTKDLPDRVWVET